MKTKITIVLMAALAATMLAASAASASHDDGDYGDGGGWYGGDEPGRAVSYINPDIGEATENRSVDEDSSCSSPDRYDAQRRSFPGSTARNVHNDSCFFEGRNETGDRSTVDAPASFVTSGRGFISACPDPDGVGPKFAVLSDRNRDGRFDGCFQSGYQDMGVPGVADRPGDFEFHVRLNNTTNMPAGEQRVAWGYDPDQDGLSDTDVKDKITINWK